MFNSPAYLLLLLPLIWVLVMIVRQFTGSGFKARDTKAKYDAVELNRWQIEKQNAQLRLEADKKALKEQDEMDEHAERNEQVYAVHESKAEHLKKQFHVGEEKETVYPVHENKERHEPKK